MTADTELCSLDSSLRLKSKPSVYDALLGWQWIQLIKHFSWAAQGKDNKKNVINLFANNFLNVTTTSANVNIKHQWIIKQYNLSKNAAVQNSIFFYVNLTNNECMFVFHRAPNTILASFWRHMMHTSWLLVVWGGIPSIPTSSSPAAGTGWWKFGITQLSMSSTIPYSAISTGSLI